MHKYSIYFIRTYKCVCVYIFTDEDIMERKRGCERQREVVRVVISDRIYAKNNEHQEIYAHGAI